MENLRRFRERAGYSQQLLAEKSGTSQHTISEIELGRRKPHGRTLRKLATALDVSIADLLEDDSPKVEEPPSQLTLNGLLEEERSPRYLRALALFARQMDRLWAAKVEGSDVDEKDFEEGAGVLFRFEDAYVKGVGTDMLAAARERVIDWSEAEREAFDDAKAAIDAWHRTMWLAYDVLQGSALDNVRNLDKYRKRLQESDALDASQRAAGE